MFRLNQLTRVPERYYYGVERCSETEHFEKEVLMKADRKKSELAMARAKIDVPEVVVRSGLSKGTVFKAFSEKNVRPSTVGKIAGALGVDVSQIMKE